MSSEFNNVVNSLVENELLVAPNKKKQNVSKLHYLSSQLDKVLKQTAKYLYQLCAKIRTFLNKNSHSNGPLFMSKYFGTLCYVLLNLKYHPRISGFDQMLYFACLYRLRSGRYAKHDCGMFKRTELYYYDLPTEVMDIDMNHFQKGLELTEEYIFSNSNDFLTIYKYCEFLQGYSIVNHFFEIEKNDENDKLQDDIILEKLFKLEENNDEITNNSHEKNLNINLSRLESNKESLMNYIKILQNQFKFEQKRGIINFMDKASKNIIHDFLEGETLNKLEWTINHWTNGELNSKKIFKSLTSSSIELSCNKLTRYCGITSMIKYLLTGSNKDYFINKDYEREYENDPLFERNDVKKFTKEKDIVFLIKLSAGGLNILKSDRLPIFFVSSSLINYPKTLKDIDYDNEFNNNNIISVNAGVSPSKLNNLVSIINEEVKLINDMDELFGYKIGVNLTIFNTNFSSIEKSLLIPNYNENFSCLLCGNTTNVKSVIPNVDEFIINDLHENNNKAEEIMGLLPLKKIFESDAIVCDPWETIYSKQFKNILNIIVKRYLPKESIEEILKSLVISCFFKNKDDLLNSEKLEIASDILFVLPFINSFEQGNDEKLKHLKAILFDYLTFIKILTNKNGIKYNFTIEEIQFISKFPKLFYNSLKSSLTQEEFSKIWDSDMHQCFHLFDNLKYLGNFYTLRNTDNQIQLKNIEKILRTIKLKETNIANKVTIFNNSRQYLFDNHNKEFFDNNFLIVDESKFPNIKKFTQQNGNKYYFMAYSKKWDLILSINSNWELSKNWNPPIFVEFKNELFVLEKFFFNDDNDEIKCFLKRVLIFEKIFNTKKLIGYKLNSINEHELIEKNNNYQCDLNDLNAIFTCCKFNNEVFLIKKY